MSLLAALCLVGSTVAAAERINQEGRILGPAPSVSTPILFNTAQADAVASAMQVMPLTSAWNEDISQAPVLSNSNAMIARIITDLSTYTPARTTLRAFYEMNFVLVPDGQPLVPISFLVYPGDSDPSPYPIPANMPIEGWPNTRSETLSQWQQDVNNAGGDRHSCVVAPGSMQLWETWQAKLVSGAWQASNGARFTIAANTLRTPGYTSGDAAGLPMFPALVRYDECQRGMVEHAMRIVVKHSRAQYIYPATHDASTPSTTDPDVPAMGQRVRLKSSFAIPSGWTIQEKAVLRGLKKYGALVADNGGFFSISVTPDDRYPSGCFNNLSTIGIGNFEIVQTTGATQGPRSGGAPTADAGADQTTASSSVLLTGVVSGSGVTAGWYLYPSAPAPGTVTFANAASAATTAMFSAAGTYTLMLRATDGIHAPAYDAVLVTVGPGSTTSTTGGTSTSGSSGSPTGSASTSGSSSGSTATVDSGGSGSGSGGCGFGAMVGSALALMVARRRRAP